MILDNLKSARTAKTSERLRIRMLFASLSSKKGSAHVVLHVFRKGANHPPAVTEPPNRLQRFAYVRRGRQARLSCHGREV